MISPLLDLFYQLRDEEGFLLSIEQYYRVENYLIQKLANDSDIAIQENPNLENPKIKLLCQALWVKSLEERQKFDQAWTEMLQFQPEINIEIAQKIPIRHPEESISKIINPMDDRESPSLEITPSGDTKIAPETSFPQIATAIEKRKKITSLDNPDYYPIGIAKLQESWQQLRPLPLESPRQTWDLKATVMATAKRGFFDQIIYQKKQLYRREIIIFIDCSDSMIPFAGFGRIMKQTWANVPHFYFDNLIRDEVLRQENGWESQSLSKVLSNYSPEVTSCLILSDAGAARKRYVEERLSATETLIRRFSRRFSRVAWLNPLPYHRWYGTTAIDIADLAEDIPNFSMFELTTEDWENLITWLKEEAIPPRHLFNPNQFQQGDNWDEDEDFFSAESRLRLFEEENEPNTRELAKRAAFPLSLSPNLLYYLRQHQDKNNQAPWYVIADILLSSLVRKIDRELYEMSPDVRKLLLEKLTPEELKSLAYQLQTYIQEQIGDYCSKSVYWQNQQWLALAYLKPSQAVNEIRQVLAEAIKNNNRVRLVRLTALLENISAALADYEPLLLLNEPIAAYSRGDLNHVGNVQKRLIDEVAAIVPYNENLFLFTAETVLVNETGKVIERKPVKAYFYDENLPEVGNRKKAQNYIRMMYIPQGEFWMGTGYGEIFRLIKRFSWDEFKKERPQHLVKVPAFHISQTPITQAQWRAVAATAKIDINLKTNPSRFKGDGLPVERVDWYQATEFCQRLSRETKREYRLPSEAEWEYACRAGTTTAFHFGETITADLANYRATETYADEPTGEYRQQTTPVGQFPPNAFGLYDMHGNVWEWCADTWHDNYDGAPTDGSVWIENGADNRSPLRGGSWFFNPLFCRSAFRLIYDRRGFVNSFGFRVVCGAGRTL
ncbi:MAG: SUMF1/EgtB/PvdO family nonheme iron enzyme [Microcystis sp. M54BS1]|uniref:SUMF1/EgtB/PvdO family nonheme iron enzyme n=1 Tax=unclassified Microcystis TaxID=2643300 RepID=UPI0025807A92|nr:MULTISPECIES: SUMF1/EgtB/PvdO family nonheme iron enzyme [unclassified Microcystis]MCA2540696.1 SUMF1/EgtB/PvdO family nonheme iron enzyme [Microcystis sp. M54BS1]MCA2596766.1 SUMF1/EgtB/PvdO family nonheme iron enzyme [Microcystis sp. M38BS1]MCA2612611.1 SUMF1/EgtB/PvdO family nonheme iron enzyme [Microcystis sp. M27BS1]MCA2508733.1 SUMF1/EgtB/PvdO family nonheme iron enzyme [Microcystis sp. M62BS1]MCA2510735.1 SUMF1/EgtB/PvdO family nonheme iron enzyme [Microcystis sp. M60BS1]